MTLKYIIYIQVYTWSI